jgi:hypothetical protein
MMARMITTTQKKNTMMPGMAYPATVLALATAASYPRPPDLFGGCSPGTTTLDLGHSLAGITWGRLVAEAVWSGARRSPDH